MNLKEFWNKYIWPESEPKVCEVCEHLKEELNYANYDRKVLLEHVIKQAFPPKEGVEPLDEEQLAPLRGRRYTPWKVQQQILEHRSRSIARGQKPVDELEKELGISHGSRVNAQDNGVSPSGQDQEKDAERRNSTVG